MDCYQGLFPTNQVLFKFLINARLISWWSILQAKDVQSAELFVVACWSLRQEHACINSASFPGDIMVHPRLVNSATGSPRFPTRGFVCILIRAYSLAPKIRWTGSSGFVPISSTLPWKCGNSVTSVGELGSRWPKSERIIGFLVWEV